MVSASHTLPPTTISNASPIPSPALNVPFFFGKKIPTSFRLDGLIGRRLSLFYLDGRFSQQSLSESCSAPVFLT
ncbi:hypothetical protein CEXT_79721 [Caerostris extrusa]|uniref:Uncharacterized protein n=1 Tax=Caerostris extrusa TaxID=172846 RepID=A0AAV4XTH8_CAEEX|nr:hypothetical protein CEXT_79721 [Caerostris extrusa]